MEVEIEKVEGIRLKKPVPLRLRQERGFWFAENRDLGVIGCGKTREVAIKDAEFVFAAMVDIFLKERDENLAEKALDLKNKLKEYVEE